MMPPERLANATGTERVPLHRLAQSMGHDSLDTTLLYVVGTKADVQAAVEGIAWT